MEGALKFVCDPNQVGSFLTVNFAAPYFLLGSAAEKYAPSVYTDISVDYLMSQATQDGSFLAESGRAPLECGDIHLTATAIRAIRLYASAAKQDRVNELTERTRKWLEQAKAEHQQELVFQLLGMYWCGSDHDRMARIADRPSVDAERGMADGHSCLRWAAMPMQRDRPCTPCIRAGCCIRKMKAIRKG